jgi:hypothetical protein
MSKHVLSGILSGGTIIGLTEMVCHPIYALLTVQNKMITVDKKYHFTRNGFTQFMVIDKNGNHYNVGNSMWYWKWDSIEDWHKLNPEQKIDITYYGWRKPLFGMFPRIVMISNIF